MPLAKLTRSGKPVCQVQVEAALGAPSLPPSERPAKRVCEVELAHDLGHQMHGEVGLRHAQRRRRPDHDAVLGRLAFLGDGIDRGERHAGDLVRRSGGALLFAPGMSEEKRPPRLAGAASGASGAGTGKPRTRAEMAASTSGMRSLATGSVITSSMRGPTAADVSRPSPMKTTVRLPASALEHRMRVGDDAVEEAAVQLVHVGADDEQEVGAVADLGQRRHDPAARLHHAEVAVLAFAQRVVERRRTCGRRSTGRRGRRRRRWPCRRRAAAWRRG